MNKYRLLFFWTLLIIAALGMLIKLAVDGVMVAVAILAVLGALILVGFGVVITLVAGNLGLRREQTSFMINAREHLRIMQMMQQIMNAQNQQLVKQLQRTPQLPAPADNVVDMVEVDESIFDILDREE